MQVNDSTTHIMSTPDLDPIPSHKISRYKIHHYHQLSYSKTLTWPVCPGLSGSHWYVTTLKKFNTRLYCLNVPLTLLHHASSSSTLVASSASVSALDGNRDRSWRIRAWTEESVSGGHVSDTSSSVSLDAIKGGGVGGSGDALRAQRWSRFLFSFGKS